MAAYIVTGLQGREHVTSEDEGAFNAGIVGTGRYVMKTAEQFAAEIVSNNIVRIKSGDLVNQGRHIRTEVNDYDDMTIENGTQSLKRNDLIVMRYKKDTSTNIELESAELVVIKGTAGATATDPTYTSGDILAGATQDDFPLYRVSLNGLNIEKVTPLFSTVPNLDELNTKIADSNKNWQNNFDGMSHHWAYGYNYSASTKNFYLHFKFRSGDKGSILMLLFGRNTGNGTIKNYLPFKSEIDAGRINGSTIKQYASGAGFNGQVIQKDAAVADQYILIVTNVEAYAMVEMMSANCELVRSYFA
ncbi:hypothetical protein [uncultured Eubacterium sp.]|uniref:hypothetical protein n=1 Tax=uncultured Eubacterium sp. TaxID=165185 RepID=UPI0025D6A09D|nr:hypothetical protein [uncultured Eubacterium sp.]